MAQSKPDEGGICVVNSNSELCSKYTNSKFFPEDSAAGVTRCKGEGYEEGSSERDPKALRMFHKRQ